ncbi:MAG: EVE domain-containing protein [Minicystis sp.]
MSALRKLAAPATPRAWVGVVSRAHVLRGVEGGFAQLCHGKHGPLARMSVGDWLVYYSPSTELGGGSPLRAFTAIGRVVGERPYRFDMGGGFVPHRRDVAYAPAKREARVQALGSRLHFVRDNPSWGMLARRGHFEIDLHDAALIAEALGVEGWVAQPLNSDCR